MTRFKGWALGFVAALSLGTVFAQVIQRPQNPNTNLSPGLTYFMAGSEPLGVDGEVAVRYGQPCCDRSGACSSTTTTCTTKVRRDECQFTPVEF